MKPLLGMNVWTASVFWFGAGFAALIAAATICAVLYHRVIYIKLRRPKYDPSYAPSCSIIIPCKGVPKDFKRNLESFTALDYDDYEVVYAVESENDAAVPIIREVISKDPTKLKLVVAGLSEKCAQKNFNQLAAIKEARDTEIYVFADSDIGPTGDWLRELVMPLSNPKNSATTGFRWQHSASGKLGEQVHSFINNVMYVAFCAAACVSKLDIVWGGSMAIRRTTFEDLKVAETWAETVVDDFSLSELIMKRGKRSLLVPTCVTATDDAIETVGGAIRWMERQTMFLKFFHTKTWLFAAMPLFGVAMLVHLWLVGALLIAKASPSTFLYIGGAGSLFMVLGCTLTTLLYPLIGPNPTYVGFVISVPVSMFSIFAGMLRTIFTNTITWGNVKYRTKISGKVASIQRL